jgi:CRISPR-associated protein Csb1
MTQAMTLTNDIIKAWADNKDGPVALHLRQSLTPVEGKGGVIFPPTYADIGYNIDEFSDGTKVVTIDSVGSQANRMEPIFKGAGKDEQGNEKNPLADLVPQISLRLGNKAAVSILDLGHRLGDAVVRASSLSEKAKQAFAEYDENDDPTLIAKLAPTSLVFGVWDSRGEGAKLPRLVNAVIRAWDVDILHRAATYLPAVDFADSDLLGPHDEEKAEKDARSALGFQHAPATWTSNDKISEYRDGKPNLDRRIPGGVIARNGIYRDVTLNLVALRRLGDVRHSLLRNYILGLALVAASDPCEEFLRQGCLLTLDPEQESSWHVVERSGKRSPVRFDREPFEFAKSAAKKFGVEAPQTFDFDKARARQLVDDKKSGAKGRGRKAKSKDKEPQVSSDQDST